MRTLLALALLLGLVTGCTSAPPSGADEPPPAPQASPEILVTPKASGSCPLLSAGEVTKVLGTADIKVTKYQPASCSFAIDGRNSLDVAVKQDLDTYFRFRDGKSARRVPDVGNDAASTAGPPRYQFDVLVDDSNYLELVLVAPGTTPAAQTQSRLTALATLVLDRL